MTRSVLVLACVLLFLLTLAGMRRGWRNRGRRQEQLPPLPRLPELDGPELAPVLTGLYVGSTAAARWQDRVVAHSLGVRAAATARLTAEGALIERQGASSLFLPAGQLVDARLEPALAGKVVGNGGLLVLRWRHGGQLLDSGLRADDKAGYPAWIEAVGALAGSSGTRPEQAAS